MTLGLSLTPLLLLLIIIACSLVGGEGMFWLAFGACAIILIARNASISGSNRNTYFILLLIHIGALIYQMTGHTLPMSGGDWGVFVRHANNMLRSAECALDFFNVFSNKLSGDLYERLCAFIYYSFGYNQIFMYAVSFLCGEIVYYGIFRISSLVTGEDEVLTSFASLIFYITPIEIVYSVDFLREMFAQALVVAACYHFFLYMKNRSPFRLLIAVAFSLFSSFVHSGYAGLVLAFTACFFLLDRRRERMNLSIERLGLVFVAIIIIYVSPIWDYIASRFAGISSLTDLAEASSTQYASLGNTTYIGTPGNSIGVLLQTPIRFIYYLVSPLPWQVRSVPTVLAMLLDASIRWVVFYRIGKMVFSRAKQLLIGNENIPIFQASIIIIFIVTLIFSWGTSNYGTAMRHRTTMYPLEIVIAFTLWTKQKTGFADNSQQQGKYIK